MEPQTIPQSEITTGEELHVSLQPLFNIEPEKKYRLFVKSIKQREEYYPPEEDITPEFIKAVEASERSIKKGDFVICKNSDETKDLFEKIWNE